MEVRNGYVTLSVPTPKFTITLNAPRYLVGRVYARRGRNFMTTVRTSQTRTMLNSPHYHRTTERKE
jgi:hypothetical protein